MILLRLVYFNSRNIEPTDRLVIVHPRISPLLLSKLQQYSNVEYENPFFVPYEL